MRVVPLPFFLARIKSIENSGKIQLIDMKPIRACVDISRTVFSLWYINVYQICCLGRGVPTRKPAHIHISLLLTKNNSLVVLPRSVSVLSHIHTYSFKQVCGLAVNSGICPVVL